MKPLRFPLDLRVIARIMATIARISVKMPPTARPITPNSTGRYHWERAINKGSSMTAEVSINRSLAATNCIWLSSSLMALILFLASPLERTRANNVLPSVSTDKWTFRFIEVGNPLFEFGQFTFEQGFSSILRFAQLAQAIIVSRDLGLHGLVQKSLTLFDAQTGCRQHNHVAINLRV